MKTQMKRAGEDRENTTFDKVGFKDYSKNKHAGGVQEMFQTIIVDAKANIDKDSHASIKKC